MAFDKKTWQREYMREYRKRDNCKQYISEYRKKKRAEDPGFLEQEKRARTKYLLKKKGGEK